MLSCTKLTSTDLHMPIAQHQNMLWSNQISQACNLLLNTYTSQIMGQLSAFVLPMAPSQYVFRPLESTNSLMR
jgi:hypothetical protein